MTDTSSFFDPVRAEVPPSETVPPSSVPDNFFAPTPEVPDPGRDHVAPNACSSCGAPVRVRRPSATGKHFCSKPECISAKQSFYRRSSKAKKRAEKEEDNTRQDTRTLVWQAIHGVRMPCQLCGRTDAINGWVHPTPRWDGACSGTGASGMNINDAWFRIIWPSA